MMGLFGFHEQIYFRPSSKNTSLCLFVSWKYWEGTKYFGALSPLKVCAGNRPYTIFWYRLALYGYGIVSNTFGAHGICLLFLFFSYENHK